MAVKAETKIPYFSTEELFELSDPLFVLDSNGHILYANTRAKEFFGYSHEEFQGMTIFELHPQSENQKCWDHFRKTLDFSLDRFFIEAVTKQGAKKEVEISASYSEKEEGHVVVAFVRDFTEKNDAHRKINQLSQFPEQNPNPVIRTSKDYRLEYANEASSDLLNELHISIGDYLPNDWQERVEEICKNGGCSNKKQNFESSIGGQCYLFTVSSVAQSEQVYIYGQNITSLKTYQEKLQATNEELNTFIYKTHHDLKNPLSSLLGLVQLAETEITEETALSYVSMIHQSAQKLDDILTTLIKTIEIKDGKKKLEEVHLPKFMGEVIQQGNLAEGSDRVKIEYNIEEEGQRIKSDKHVLFSILENLVTNGVKYRDEAKNEQWVKINVKTYDHDVIFQVADNGVGIDAQSIDQIFKMFYRANNAKEGTGLGLFLVKKGVEKLEGTLDVDSEKGKGTTFEIRIPNALMD